MQAGSMLSDGVTAGSGGRRKAVRDRFALQGAPAQGNQSLSRELRASALCPGLDQKFPDIPVSLEENTEVPGTTSSETLLPS